MPDFSHRKVGNRNPRNVAIVVTEGRTEKIFFNGLKQRMSNVEIKTPKTSPTDAVNLVNLCIFHIDDYGLNLDHGDVAICAFDIQGNVETKLIEAIDLANGHGITLALTNPCFELWYILHFRDLSHQINCHDAQTLLEEHIENYSKTTDYSRILKPKKEQAVLRAERLWHSHGLGDRVRPIQPNPSTSVHMAVKAIDYLMNRNKALG